MCLIIALPSGVMPVQEHLANGVRLNPHGFGFAVGRSTCHTLDADQALGSFLRWRAMHPDMPALFHARHATGNSPRTLANCHPFRIPGGFIAHNGYLFPHEGIQSDTAIFAREILPLYDLDDPARRTLLEQRMGPNKAVIFRGYQVDILNARQGIFLEDGTWMSNADYLGEPHKVTGACLYAGHPTHACFNQGELPLGDKWICKSCDYKAQERRRLLMKDL